MIRLLEAKERQEFVSLKIFAGNLNNKGKQAKSDSYFSLRGLDANRNAGASLVIVDGILTIEISN